MEIQKGFLAEAALFSLREPTSRTHLYAAMATAVDNTVDRVSFPPKPPPVLLTRTTIRFSGMPSMLATKLCEQKEKILILNAPFGHTSGLTQSLPDCTGLITALNSDIPTFGNPCLLPVQVSGSGAGVQHSAVTTA